MFSGEDEEDEVGIGDGDGTQDRVNEEEVEEK